MNKDRRKDERIICNYDYIHTARSLNADFECKLKNISITGACIMTDAPLLLNESIVLHICRDKDIPMNGKIVWEKDGTFGISFNLDSSESFENISYIMNNYSL